MPSRVKKPSNPKKLKTVTIALRKVLKDIGDEIKEELTQIVSPFDSNIKVIAVNRIDSRDYIVEIMGSGDTATINAAGEPVSSHDLLKFLDGGTSVRYVGMPNEFSNETTPNSKDTTHKDYDRDDIYFLSEPTIGMTARRWFKLLIEEFEPIIKERLNKEIRGYLR
jgi:hypothetical protein